MGCCSSSRRSEGLSPYGASAEGDAAPGLEVSNPASSSSSRPLEIENANAPEGVASVTNGAPPARAPTGEDGAECAESGDSQHPKARAASRSCSVACSGAAPSGSANSDAHRRVTTANTGAEREGNFFDQARREREEKKARESVALQNMTPDERKVRGTTRSVLRLFSSVAPSRARAPSFSAAARLSTRPTTKRSRRPRHTRRRGRHTTRGSGSTSTATRRPCVAIFWGRIRSDVQPPNRPPGCEIPAGPHASARDLAIGRESGAL